MDIREDISFMEGRLLQTVGFGLYSIHLGFSPDDAPWPNPNSTYIEVVCDLEYSQANGIIQKWDSENSRESHICMNRVMEYTVIKAFVDSNDDLHLHFENDDKIRIICAHGMHESYIVHHNKDFEVID